MKEEGLKYFIKHDELLRYQKFDEKGRMYYKFPGEPPIGLLKKYKKWQ